MNEARLRVIDKLLQKGWQSYYDMAKVIHESFVEEKQFGKLKKWSGEVHDNDCFYDAILTEYRPSITHDFLDIPDIWAYSHRGKLGKKGRSTGEKNQIRAEARGELFDIKEQKEFSSNEALELFIKGQKQYRDNPTVQFFRYKNPKYSIFKSGDFERFVAQGTKKRTKSAFERSIKDSVTTSEVNQAKFDSGVVLEFDVSDQIRRSIRLQDELKEFAQGSKRIVNSLLQKISQETEQKKHRWVQDTIRHYGNVLELVRIPLSNYTPRDIADQIHDFAFFLATENQYHLLGNRFDEALSIYQRLRREQRHLVEDIEQGLITGEEANIDVLQLKEQMAKDDESIAAILLSIARVRLDSGDKDKAKEALDQAKGLAGNQTLVRGQICHLESILACLNCDTEAAISLINEACGIVSALKLEESGEGLAIMASKADLLQRTGDTEGAVTLYETLLNTSCDNEEACEVQTSAHLNLAILNLSAGQIDEADKNVSEALDGFEKLYSKEPDRILPSLLNAKYIKGLVLAHKGDIEESISTLESAAGLVPDNRPELYVFCGTELLEVYATLSNLYQSIGVVDKAEEVSNKARTLLQTPGIYLTEEQRESLIQSL